MGQPVNTGKQEPAAIVRNNFMKEIHSRLLFCPETISIHSLFLSLPRPSTMNLCTQGERMMRTLHSRRFAMTPSLSTMALSLKMLLLQSVL